MRLGLLVCDHVRPELLDVAGDYDDMFRRLFSRYEDVELVPYDLVEGIFPADPGECDGWLTTGSRHSVNDDEPWIRQLEELVREVADSGRPFVGICFGHQMLAKAFGGTVVRSERGWGVGSIAVEVRDETGLGPSYRLLNSHQDQVDTPPPGARILGWSQQCPISLLAIGQSLVGIQGHPEFQPAYLKALLESRRGSVIPEAVAAEGIRSLRHGTDADRIARWIVDLVREGQTAAKTSQPGRKDASTLHLEH